MFHNDIRIIPKKRPDSESLLKKSVSSATPIACPCMPYRAEKPWFSERTAFLKVILDPKKPY
jgi:hypothetical protein